MDCAPGVVGAVVVFLPLGVDTIQYNDRRVSPTLHQVVPLPQALHCGRTLTSGFLLVVANVSLVIRSRLSAWKPWYTCSALRQMARERHFMLSLLSCGIANRTSKAME